MLICENSFLKSPHPLKTEAPGSEVMDAIVIGTGHVDRFSSNLAFLALPSLNCEGFVSFASALRFKANLNNSSSSPGFITLT